MAQNTDEFAGYFEHLQRISPLGRAYKKIISSPVLYACARSYGTRLVEVGCGIGSGVLGTFTSKTLGLEINPLAVEHCVRQGLQARLIPDSGRFPIGDGACDACILDNVLEHIPEPRQTLDECLRITRPHGGLIVAVPGSRGFASDPDHKIFYDTAALKRLHEHWQCLRVFSMPFGFVGEWLSSSARQYCLVASYRKI